MTNLPLLAKQLGERLLSNSKRIATAESCTGGGVSAVITSIDGSSQWFDCGLVTYSNQMKVSLLGVKPLSIDENGAVSEAVALEMLHGLLNVSGADLGLAVTGIAGPSGGTDDKPVGTVCIAWGEPNTSHVSTYQFSGTREQVRGLATERALINCLGVLQ